MKKIRGLLVAVSILGLIAVTSCEVSTTASDQEDSTDQFAFKTLQTGTTDMFSGLENHFISSTTAHDMIDRYTLVYPDEPNGWYFGRDAVLALLAQDSIVGLRIYHALKEDGSYSPVIFGVTSDGNDLDDYHNLAKSLGDSTGIILDVAFPCPPFCSGD